MAKWRVIGEWIVEAATASEAEGVVENAVARMVVSSELETCDATLEDGEAESED